MRAMTAPINTSESPADECHDDDAARGGESEVVGVRKELLLSGLRSSKNLPGRSHILKKDVLTVFTTAPIFEHLDLPAEIPSFWLDLPPYPKGPKDPIIRCLGLG